MHEVYFFALQVHAWLVAMPIQLPARAKEKTRSLNERIRLLNDTFGTT